LRRNYCLSTPWGKGGRRESITALGKGGEVNPRAKAFLCQSKKCVAGVRKVYKWKRKLSCAAGGGEVLEGLAGKSNFASSIRPEAVGDHSSAGRGKRAKRESSTKTGQRRELFERMNRLFQVGLNAEKKKVL